MKAYPHFTKRISHDLNGVWDFTFSEDLAFGEVDPGHVVYTDRLPVPSAFDAFPAYAGKRGLGIYRCFVNVTPGVPALLKVGGAGMSCEVFADGESLARHIGTYTPFEVRLPASDTPRRELVVVTDNRFDYRRCPLHEIYFDFYQYGGIIRQVWLEELPAQPIARAHVVIDDVATGRITVHVDCHEAVTALTYSIDGAAYQSADLTPRPGHGVSFSASVPNPTPWSPDAPTLHLISIDSGDDAICTRFGLRTVSAVAGQILINGEATKLLGYCRHEAHPQFGPCSPDMLLVTDLQLLKDIGCNFVRGSHYQQDPRFLDLCDELGVLVFAESLGWGQDGTRFEDRHFVEAQLAQTRTMVLEDFNHPSIILWGFLNEGGSNQENARDCYLGLIKLIRSLDPSRLVTYASNRFDADLYFDHVDVVSVNCYPGWYAKDPYDEYPLHEVLPRIHGYLTKLDERGLADKPFIISEVGAGAIYGWRDPLQGHWTEQYQAELLRVVCEETVANPRIAGLALWQFSDCRTYQGGHALGRPRAFNNKGTLDEYRRPKAAYQTVKSIFTQQGR